MTSTSSSANHSTPEKSFSILQTILAVAAVTLGLLVIPFTASFITSEMQWTLSDYILAWVMFFVAGLSYALVSRLSSDYRYRAAVGLAAFTGLFMVWSNLAVGIVGNEDNPFNLVYFILIMIGLVAAFWVRFDARGLSRVALGMCFLLAAIAVYAVFSGMQDIPESSTSQIIGVHMFFITPLLISAILFHQHSEGNE